MTGALALAAWSLAPRVTAAAPSRVALVSDAAPLETVVTAPLPPARAPREDQAAAATVVLPGDSPRARDDLGQLMAEVPGVIVTRSGSYGSFTTLALRGSNPDEVRIYVDGIPLNLAEGGAVDISTLPLGDVERVEVYRGSTPLAFGESALGGVVSITTRTPGTPLLGARAGGGSFDTMFGDVTGGGRLGRVRIYAGAHALAAGGSFAFHDDNRTTLNPGDDTAGALRSNNDVRQADGVLRAAVDLPGRRALSLGALAFARDQGIPSPGSADDRFRMARGLGYLRYESRDDLGAGGRLTAQVFASGERDVFDAPMDVRPAMTRDTTLSAGAGAHASKPVASWLGVAAVLEARRETFSPTDQALMAPTPVPARRLVAVAGGEIDLWWRRLQLDLIPSARIEAVRDVATVRVFSTAGQPAAGEVIGRALPILRLGVVRAFGPSVAFKANAGRYARLPSFLELYGNTGRLVGNAGLLPERGTNADVGLSADLAAGALAVSSRTTAFAARADDLIAWQLSSWGQAQAQNLSSARVLGVEQELRLGLGRHARLVAQGTFTDARDTGPGTAHHGRQLALHPRWHLYGRPELGRVALGRAVVLGAFADADFVAGNYQDAANLSPIPPRVLIGAGVSAEVPRWGIRLVASAQDLNDSRIGDIPNWPLPGRSVFLALAWAGAFHDRDKSPRSE
jgi:outer membrane receptor protein involved in Fe transport